jgi:hypothetical protein
VGCCRWARNVRRGYSAQPLVLENPGLGFGFGLETEHGLTRPIGADDADVEARAVTIGDDRVCCHVPYMVSAGQDCIPDRSGSSEVHIIDAFGPSRRGTASVAASPARVCE